MAEPSNRKPWCTRNANTRDTTRQPSGGTEQRSRVQQERCREYSGAASIHALAPLREPGSNTYNWLCCAAATHGSYGQLHLTCRRDVVMVSSGHMHVNAGTRELCGSEGHDGVHRSGRGRQVPGPHVRNQAQRGHADRSHPARTTCSQTGGGPHMHSVPDPRPRPC